jgi:hypothetical protein
MFKSTRQLRDAYRFPGFEPRGRVRGVFGDPLARVVVLDRRRKKQSAKDVVLQLTAITTTRRDWFEICRAVRCGSIWRWIIGAWNVCSVVE